MCLACHESTGPGPDSKLEGFSQSVHQRLPCLSCHANAADFPHGATRVSKPVQAKTCGACHGEKETVPYLTYQSSSSWMEEPVKSYLLTVHGQVLETGNLKAATCSDCHGVHDIRRAGDSRSRVNHSNIPKVCGRCHQAQASEFNESVHGQALKRGLREVPACTDCHGEHTIRPVTERASSVWRGAVTKTCSGCHANEKIALKFGLPVDRVKSYQDSYHGLAGRSGDVEVANCGSCHGWHLVLPASDERSSVHPANLTQTCGQCHGGAIARMNKGAVHVALTSKGEGSRLAHWVRLFYLVFIPFLVVGMASHHLIDLFRKMRDGQHHHRLPAGELLLTVSERIQHLILVVSFFVLAYSGFALKYPETWFARLFPLLGGEGGRQMAHRGAAIIFVSIGVIHLMYLFGTAFGRRRLSALLPRVNDALDMFSMIRYNLGLSRRRPSLERFSYIEKMEYWALLWGSVVMVASGAILLFHNFALARLPFWVIETARVVHFMEAILACLAILVWHFYCVIFDPEVYPMNWAWVWGRKKWNVQEKTPPGKK